jgi:hypothetical protein
LKNTFICAQKEEFKKLNSSHVIVRAGCVIAPKMQLLFAKSEQRRRRRASCAIILELMCLLAA